MCADLLLSHPEPQHLHIVPTTRDLNDNLALSSRNAYLSTSERKFANTLYLALQSAQKSWEDGLTKSECIIRSKELIESRRAEVEGEVEMKLDYLEINDGESFDIVADEVKKVDLKGKPMLLSGALWVGKTRLIDNIILGDPATLGILPV